MDGSVQWHGYRTRCRQGSAQQLAQPTKRRDGPMGLHLKFRENPLYESMTPCALVAITFGQRALLYSEIIMLNSRAIGKYKFYSFYIHT